jgi:hypothetical protein
MDAWPVTMRMTILRPGLCAACVGEAYLRTEIEREKGPRIGAAVISQRNR